jgi:hypothetical protein
MGKPCRVTFEGKVFFKPDFVKRFLDTLHLEDDVVDNSTYLKSIGYENAFNEGDPLLIREKKAEAKAEAKVEEKKAPKEQPKAEPKAQAQEVEQYQPITIKEIYNDKFSKENAMYYDEDERETDSGRMSTYVSSMTMDVTNDDGDSIGALTRNVDEDKITSWNGEDFDGMPLADDDFNTMDEAKQAMVNKWNKAKKKEFDKEAKREAKEQEKAELKAAKAEARAKAKSESKAPKAETKASKESIFVDFDSTNNAVTIKNRAEANKAFKEKHGDNAAVAKAISTNFEAIANELESKGVFIEIDCK